VILTVPKIEQDRYYSLQFVDAYTFNFHYVGSRATGNDGGKYLLAGPNWSGETPGGISELIQTETEFVFVIYRTQLMGPDDLDNVKKIQAGYTAQTLSEFLGRSGEKKSQGPMPKPKTLPSSVPTDRTPTQALKPLTPKEVRTDLSFFEILDLTLKFGPIPPAEKDLRAKFARLGIGTGEGFDPNKLSPEISTAVKEGMTDAWDAFDAFKKSKVDTGQVTSADLFGTRSKIDGNWMYRMAAVVLGIYGNSAVEAFYPLLQRDSDGNALSGANNYTLTFPKGKLPPVHAFWSVTMYDLPQSLLVENPINRYLINSPMLPELNKNSDGSLTIYIQHDSPGKEKESNWLPAPEGPFWMAMRLYWPTETALKGEWKAPTVVKAN
jgi:hypothetical protein